MIQNKLKLNLKKQLELDIQLEVALQFEDSESGVFNFVLPTWWISLTIIVRAGPPGFTGRLCHSQSAGSCSGSGPGVKAAVFCVVSCQGGR